MFLGVCAVCHAEIKVSCPVFCEWTSINYLSFLYHGRRQYFLCRGQSGGKAEGLGGKEKSILLNIKRVRKLKY